MRIKMTKIPLSKDNYYPAQIPPLKGAPSYHSLPLPEVRTLIAADFIIHEVLSTLSCILVAHIFIKGWHYAMVYRTS